MRVSKLIWIFYTSLLFYYIITILVYCMTLYYTIHICIYILYDTAYIISYYIIYYICYYYICYIIILCRSYPGMEGFYRRLVQCQQN